MKQFAVSLMAAFILSGMTGGVYAADCGEPPMDVPPIPSENATAEQIRAARDGVLAYSSKVDEYIACTEQRLNNFSTYMTKEQIERRHNDLNDLHNRRRDLQLALNEAIRTFRRQTSDS